ncbi:S9 family peptidase [Bacillus sp. T33-2]|uniref:S9 family peptidase n=1 Tax=Bacillus sp. T33-2 TaxID=2054168 RepID=UPI000C77EF8C|nr:S9 family peptidase [Bacillus sp. T33-2]PLR97696.1 peptidase [Bacillus sp. T33-2]
MRILDNRRYVSAEDLYSLKSVTDPQLSPDGTSCIFVQTEIVKEKHEYASNLYCLNVKKKNGPVQWTFGEFRNSSPRWSPDGSKIAFLSNRSGKNQIYLLNASGGEARQVTFCRNGASSPAWSPDGRRIAFSVNLKPHESIHDTEMEEKEQKKLKPLEVVKMKYKSDASGFWDGSFKQIAVIDIETGSIEQLTTGTADFELHSWSPDGKWIAASADLSQNVDSSFKNDVLLIDFENKEISPVTGGTGYFGDAAFSPDGKYLGFIGHEREYENATLSKVWIHDLECKKTSCLTEDLDVMVGNAAVGDFHQGASIPGIAWGEDRQSFYFLATDNGNTVIYYGNVNGEIYPALLHSQNVYGFALDGKSQRIVAAVSRPAMPGELFLLEVTTGSLEQLTSINEEFMSQVSLVEPDAISLAGRDGTPLHGWVMKPAGFETGKKYPLVVEIHGGPHMMYANTYFHEFQLLSANGYAVLYINPRGSHGYGQEFVNAVRGDYGGGDYEDIMAATEYAVKTFDFIDNDRLGVTGGSYGGFMTNWIVGHTNIFKAAVTQRSISNWISFYGVSDIGYYFTEWQIKSDLNDVETLWKHSPLAYAGNINTPLLILHSEKDYRCPIEQAEQLFIALKRQNKQAKFIRFPEANHELSRSGNPGLRIERLNYIIGWFDQYLK